jgi:hypothetical protein
VDLVRDERFVHAVVEQFELGGRVIRNARMQDFSFREKAIEAGGGVVRGGQPVGTVDEEEIDFFEVEQA